MARARIIDADGHVMEMFGTWSDWIPETDRQDVVRSVLAAIAPREGNTAGYEGAALEGAGLSAIQHEVKNQGFNAGADVDAALNVTRPGGWVGTERLKDMDADGLEVAVLYPTSMLAVADDVHLFQLACRAYNDWLSDYCSADRARLVGVGVVPLQDIDAAITEMRRCVEVLGFRAVMIRPAPYLGTRKLHDHAYDPFWAAACELGIGIGVHPFPFADLPDATRGLWLDEGMKFPTDDVALRQGLANMIDIQVAVAWFTAGGICERFPELKVAFLEGSGGWLPTLLERLEHHLHVFGSPHQTSSPSEMFRRQCYISFDPDEGGLAETARSVGADRILWASDYPHPDAKIPGTVGELRETISVLPRSEQTRILGENAAAFYGI
jgi:predicted TIM-barrel fold metal-dependent hydrolase